MHFRWLGVVAVAFSLILATTAAARLELSKEEREIVEWWQPTSAALVFEESLADLVLAEDMTRRAVLLARCPDFRQWGSRERFTNPKYAAAIRESARLFGQQLADDAKAKGTLPNDWSVAAVHAWRSWSEPQRQGWLTFIRNPAAKRGFELQQTLAALAGFKEFAVDRNNGAENMVWPAWLDEFLIKAGLRDTFRDVANAIEAGLGDRFAAEAARPVVHPVDERQRQALVDVIKRLERNWAAIAQTMTAQIALASDTGSVVQSWLDHPQAREIEALAIATRTDPPSGVSPSLLIASGRAEDDIVRRSRTLMRTLQEKAPATLCGTLQR